MTEALAWITAVLLFMFGVRRLARWRLKEANSANATAQFYVCGFAVCLALSFVVLSPAAWALVTRSSSSTVAMLVGDGLRRASLTFLALTSLWLGADPGARPRPSAWAPRGQRRLRETPHLAVAVAVQLTSCLLLFLAHPSVERSGLLVVHGAGQWLLIAYNALFTGYALACLALLVRSLKAHGRGTGPGPVRVGLRLLAGAVAVGMLWTAWSLDDVLDVLRNGTQGGSDDPVSMLFGALCAVLTTGGATATLWGFHLLAPVRWLRACRSHRAIHPLWAALHAELPQIALQPVRSGPHVLPWRAEFALYRRVIEIRDAVLLLRPYTPTPASTARRDTPPRDGSGIVDDADGCSPMECGDAPEVDAVAEAALLAQALANFRAGRRPGPGAAALPGPRQGPRPSGRQGPAASLHGGTVSLDSEVRRLAQVAVEFRRRLHDSGDVGGIGGVPCPPPAGGR
ncbi:MAB_1171c family putative transporter [Streptacidiphilus anmyonensis]|uniref:MAB_1171c family putative transporter n=1 Tax=Streptacidiphilus anmyonensis TaxID=405782 RepID=UPI0034E2769D